MSNIISDGKSSSSSTAQHGGGTCTSNSSSSNEAADAAKKGRGGGGGGGGGIFTKISQLRPFQFLLKKAFQVCDKNNSGRINKDEFYVGYVRAYVRMAVRSWVWSFLRGLRVESEETMINGWYNQGTEQGLPFDSSFSRSLDPMYAHVGWKQNFTAWYFY